MPPSRRPLAIALLALLVAGGAVFARLCTNPDLRGTLPAYFVAPGPSPEELATYKTAVTEAVAEERSIEALYPGRAGWDEVVAALAIRPTDVVADIGAGTGRLEVALLERGVPFARLYAVEPHPPSVEFLRWLLSNTRLPNADRVVPTPSQWHDVRLPRGAIDVAILFNTPLFIEDPTLPEEWRRNNRASLVTLRDAIGPGGRLHVFERTNKLAELGGAEPCAAVGDALAPLGFRMVESRRMRLDWAGPLFPRHCWVLLERIAS